MRKNIFFPILLFLSILILLLFSLPAGAVEVTKPTTAEIIDEVARFTGLSSDLTQLVFKSEPELLAKFGKTVFAVQVLNQLLEAKDTEAMKSIFNFAVSNLADYLMKQVVHPAVGTFFSVVKAYKASLEVVRDYIIIPKFDNDTYIRYKKARGGVLDYRYANPTEAFEQATFAPFGGYYLLKEKRYKELIKAKGYNPELIGDKLKASLRRDIDNFWMKRMEAKYIQERLKDSQEAMVKSIWKSAQNEIDLLKKLALELGTIHAGLFITSKDIPEGWWVVKDEKHYPYYPPSKVKQSEFGYWDQAFTISDAKGYKLDADSGMYFRMVGQEKIHDFKLKAVRVRVNMLPRFQNGKDLGKMLFQNAFEHNGAQPLDNSGAVSIEVNKPIHFVKIFFYRGMYCCYVSVHTYKDDRSPITQKHVELAYHFSRIIRGKMPAIVIEKPK